MASEAGEKLNEVEARHEDAQPPPRSTRIYYWIFAWLMALLILTVIASWVPFDKLFPGLNAIVAFTIAAAKALLVVLFFMHVKQASKVTWVFSSAALLWLGIMFTLTFGDYLTRPQFPTGLKVAPSEQRPYPFEHVNRWIQSPVSDRAMWASPLNQGVAPATPPPPPPAHPTAAPATPSPAPTTRGARP
jgi:cytochrome c oxidase subunit 4